MKFTNIKRSGALGLAGSLTAVLLLLTQCRSIPSAGGDTAQTARLQPLEIPPPVPTKAGNLVDIREIDPTIVVDLRYATSNNITGRALYPANMPCLVHKATARRLRRAQSHLQKRGYGLKIWDAYRPPSVQRKLFEAAPRGGWVAEPVKAWSHHNFGTAVDVTLVDSKGREQSMPTAFDDLSPKASFTYRGGDPRIAENLELLQEAMKEAGFEVVLDEWWHFYDTWTQDSELVYAPELGIELPN